MPVPAGRPCAEAPLPFESSWGGRSVPGQRPRSMSAIKLGVLPQLGDGKRAASPYNGSVQAGIVRRPCQFPPALPVALFAAPRRNTIVADSDEPTLQKRSHPFQWTRPLNEYSLADFYAGKGNDPFEMIAPFGEWWDDALERGYYLYGMPLTTAPATRVAVQNPKRARIAENLINFASYNYLGLSYRPEVIEAAVSAVGHYGIGAGGGPLLSGTTDLHERLANDLASFMGQASALLFSSGYSANLSIIDGLMRPGDTVLADQIAHASLVDGIRLAGIRPRFFRHNDAADLGRKLSRSKGKKLVIVEGVYSMDGDTAPLNEIVEACRCHGARILIDEAHSAFLYGPNGRGVAEDLGVHEDMDIIMGTTSKTLGGIGGYVTGSYDLINYLRAYARPRIFSGGLPPAVVAGLLKSLEIIRTEPELRTRLWRNATLMRERLNEAGVDTGTSTSQVIPIMVRDEVKTFAITEELFDHGVYICPINYPAVAKNKTRLRMTVSAGHSEAEIEEGARVVISALRKYGVCD